MGNWECIFHFNQLKNVADAKKDFLDCLMVIYVTIKTKS